MRAGCEFGLPGTGRSARSVRHAPPLHSAHGSELTSFHSFTHPLKYTCERRSIPPRTPALERCQKNGSLTSFPWGVSFPGSCGAPDLRGQFSHRMIGTRTATEFALPGAPELQVQFSHRALTCRSEGEGESGRGAGSDHLRPRSVAWLCSVGAFIVVDTAGSAPIRGASAPTSRPVSRDGIGSGNAPGGLLSRSAAKPSGAHRENTCQKQDPVARA